MDKPEVERRIHNGRCLLAFDDAGERVIGWPEMAQEAVRAISHLTRGAAMPAPTLYQVLGDLKEIGYMLPQAVAQLGGGLRASLDEFDVYDSTGDAEANVTNAQAHLQEAAEHARRLGESLGAAQAAVAGQGYSTGETQ